MCVNPSVVGGAEECVDTEFYFDFASVGILLG